MADHASKGAEDVAQTVADRAKPAADDVSQQIESGADDVADQARSTAEDASKAVKVRRPLCLPDWHQAQTRTCCGLCGIVWCVLHKDVQGPNGAVQSEFSELFRLEFHIWSILQWGWKG